MWSDGHVVVWQQHSRKYVVQIGIGKIPIVIAEASEAQEEENIRRTRSIRVRKRISKGKRNHTQEMNQHIKRPGQPGLVTIRSKEGVSVNEDNKAEEGRKEKEMNLMYTVKHANQTNSLIFDTALNSLFFCFLFLIFSFSLLYSTYSEPFLALSILPFPYFTYFDPSRVR